MYFRRYVTKTTLMPCKTLDSNLCKKGKPKSLFTKLQGGILAIVQKENVNANTPSFKTIKTSGVI